MSSRLKMKLPNHAGGMKYMAMFPLTWKVTESQGKSANVVGGQGILVACERKQRFLSTFQGKVATR